MGRLSVRLLGALQVALDGTPVAGFESDKERALLAHLVEECQQPHRREKLAGLLWPERTEAAARNNLRRVLSNLRRLLGDRSQSDPPFLLVTGQASGGMRSWPKRGYTLCPATPDLVPRLRG